MHTCIICNSNRIVTGFRLDRFQVCICSSCGFRWLSPQPTERELSDVYSSQYFLDEGHEDATQIVSNLKRATAALYLQQLVADESKPQTQPSLLEIGCGMGEFLLEAQSKGFSVSGLEVTDHLVDFANRRLGFPGVRKAYLESSGFDKQSFDVVVMFDVIEHVRNPLDVMTRVNGLLRESGRFFIATPSLDSWSATLLGRNWMEYKVEHLWYFNRNAMQLLLEKAGFYKARFYPNCKVLNLDYVTRHFARFPVKGITPLMNLARKMTPYKLAYAPFKVVASGMAVIAEKRGN